MKVDLAGTRLADVRRYLSITYIAGAELDDQLQIVNANRPTSRAEYTAAWDVLKLIDEAELIDEAAGHVTLELEPGPVEDMLQDTLDQLRRRGRT